MTTPDQIRSDVMTAADRLLEAAKALSEPVMKDALGNMGPPLDVISGYHAGFNHADGSPAPGAGGKGMCLALSLCAAEACGDVPACAVDAAVAVELLHSFSHLHDDFMDRDRTRRHRPTAWVVYGDALAVLAGDALIGEAFRLVPQEGAALLAETLAAMCAGQAMDLSFEKRPVTGPGAVTVAEYLEMAAGKTGALYEGAAGLGALAAGADARTVRNFRTTGAALGLLAQIADDLNGLVGDPAMMGKPVGSDLRAGKKTLPLLAALTDSGRGQEELREALSRGCRDSDEAAKAARLISEAGGTGSAERRADQELGRAQTALDQVPMSAEIREKWNSLATFIRNRKV
ncbi:polyprenyl synthetase family protein [Streptomyces sp. ET3-23]|uniref:polyprenyl synthetase family protein n=1 Tax=Streptomyces sp. ET3-23 TaxID=2885643 RepID=UPI001D10BB31|nr:polyprenyl synthetase family protein [Streptomyces sp. ET3-23]MCC2280663.1 polyprenyl synthetase family protein [Streptomyces sp. ET3-23]